MKTDRELLELAAKAAGKQIDIESFGEYQDAHNGCVVADGEHWNPFTDDGDAMRLAAECKLTVCMDGDASVSAHTAYDPSICFVTQFIKHSECKHAATRRAIVRAAAEIQLQREKA